MLWDDEREKEESEERRREGEERAYFLHQIHPLSRIMTRSEESGEKEGRRKEGRKAATTMPISSKNCEEPSGNLGSLASLCGI